MDLFLFLKFKPKCAIKNFILKLFQVENVDYFYIINTNLLIHAEIKFNNFNE